jgi:hypothetical protein
MAGKDVQYSVCVWGVVRVLGILLSVFNDAGSQFSISTADTYNTQAPAERQRASIYCLKTFQTEFGLLFSLLNLCAKCQ